jgi:uncharacterized membrane protein
LIGWRSVPGADIENAGSVRFSDAPAGRGTVVRLELAYEPPLGRLGAVAAKLLPQDPLRLAGDSLRCFKQLMETGEIATAPAPGGMDNRSVNAREGGAT